MDSSSLRRTVVATICALGMLAWLWAMPFPGTAPDGDAAAPESSTESGLVASQASLQVAPASGRASRRGATAGGGRESELAPTHRVHVRLPDGSEAAGGEAQAWVLFWSNPPGMEYGVKMQGRARIGPGGIAEIALDDPAERVSALLLEVPGHPPHLHHVRGEGEPIEVQLPREDTVVLTGSIVDCTGHGLPGLPILLTSGTASEEIVFDTDLDIEARRLGPAGIHFVHVEATTDAAGRFSSRVPTSVADDWNSRLLKIQVLSRDASWFLSPAARFPMPAEGGEPTPIVATAVPGVCLDLRLSTSAPSRIFRPWLAIGTFAGSGPEWRAELAIPRSRFEDADECPREERRRVQLRRPVPVGEGFDLIVATSAERLDPTVRRTCVSAGISTVALELPMDAANDVSRTGLVELTISELSGRVGATIDHTLEIVSVDGLSLRAQHLDWLCWASEHRVDVRLPAGKWSLWLHPHGTEEVTLAAQVDVSPGVTTRVTMEDARKQ